MATNSRAKGKREELAAVHFLRDCGFAARRGQQHKGTPDSPDIECDSLPHLEVKSRQKIDIGTQELDNAIAKAYEESPDGKALVLWRQPRKQWRLTWICGLWKVPVTVAGNDRVRQALIKHARD